MTFFDALVFGMLAILFISAAFFGYIVVCDARRPSAMERLAHYDAEMACQKIHYQHMEDREDEKDES